MDSRRDRELSDRSPARVIPQACAKRKGAVDLSVAEAVDAVNTSRGHGFEVPRRCALVCARPRRGFSGRGEGSARLRAHKRERESSVHGRTSL